MTTIVRTIYQQRSRVIDADRPKFSNRQPTDQAAMPSGHLAVSVRVELLACKCANAQMHKRHPCPRGGTSAPRATRLTDQESSAPVVRFAAALDTAGCAPVPQPD